MFGNERNVVNSYDDNVRNLKARHIFVGYSLSKTRSNKFNLL